MREPATPLATLADSLAGTFPTCDDAPLARALLRELAQGQPVAEPTLTAAADRWPNVELDEHGRVIAFGGLSPPRPRTASRSVAASCTPGTRCSCRRSSSNPQTWSRNCAVTGAPVRLAVDQSGVRDVDPEDLWVSFPPPGAASIADITGTFCCHVHFLAGRTAADQWLSRHEGATVLSVSDAFELGRLATRCCA
jgi:alkylmercury lyase